jgi:hypothetical protein
LLYAAPKMAAYSDGSFGLSCASRLVLLSLIASASDAGATAEVSIFSPNPTLKSELLNPGDRKGEDSLIAVDSGDSGMAS